MNVNRSPKAPLIWISLTQGFLFLWQKSRGLFWTPSQYASFWNIFLPLAAHQTIKHQHSTHVLLQHFKLKVPCAVGCTCLGSHIHNYHWFAPVPIPTLTGSFWRPVIDAIMMPDCVAPSKTGASYLEMQPKPPNLIFEGFMPKDGSW